MRNDRRETGTRKPEREAYYRNEIFEMMVNRMSDIIILFTVDDYTVDYVSPNIERQLGITVDEIKRDFSRLAATSVEAEELTTQELMRRVTQGSGSQLHERIHQKSGEKLWFQESVLRGRFKDSKKFVMILSDRTQEVRAQEQLEQALAIAKSANEGKSNFLANMSHDIRTPMNAIIGFSHLLEKESDDPAKMKEYIRKISASSQHLLSLINDLLDMTRLESGKAIINVSEFNLSEFLEEFRTIMRPQLKAKKQNFEMKAKGLNTDALIADKTRLRQILLNILTNAVKYTPEGGNIEFTITQLEQVSRRFSHLRFEVSDNGIGMSRDFVEHVFEPFARERHSTISGIPGTGLGLAIVKNLVDLMGGTIQVQSEQGVGTTFTVELELQLAKQEVDESFWKELGIVRILSVDDDVDICRDIEASMSDTGVEVQSVHSGEAAIEKVKEAGMEGKQFDMILLDWKMPGMDGIETAKHIRDAIGDQVPILVLTAYDWTDVEETAREAGIDGFLAKPFFITNFQQTVEMLGTEYEAKDNADAAKNVLSGLKILAAEDNEFNAEILCELLTMEGAECDLAENGEIALDMFKASAPGHYDVILMDVRMPVMDGYEATRAIRGCGHPDAGKILIAAMTANAFAEDVQDALDAGMNVHMAKPLDMDLLKAELFRFLKQR